MCRTIIALALLMGAASQSAAQVDEAKLQKLVRIICDNGGSMRTEKAAQVLPQEGYTMEETQAIVAELEDRDLVAPTQGLATLKLRRKACR